MNEKFFDTLELNTILHRLADCCVSEPAKEKALALKPAFRKEEVRSMLSETSAAVNMMVLKGSPSFYGVKDVSYSLQRASIGGSLSTQELLDIARLLQSARITKSYIADDKFAGSCIDSYFTALSVNRFLEERIFTCILSENEIADNASPDLADIRRKIRAESANIRSSLQKIISSPSYAKYLQEPIITTRSGRFVVPVKIEYKSEIPGLVHDISSSGMTVFIEPNAAVKSNNELRELYSKEKNEIEKILRMLSAACAEHEADIVSDLNLLTTLDFIFGKAKLSYQYRGTEALGEESGINLKKARHPLLDPAKAVAVDIMLGNEFDTLIITGPNTGGKTVTLKTIGLLSLMNQCGLHIPADDQSNLPVFSNIMADVGDEQSIEQNLSTFSSHMRNIVTILDECDDRSLVLFDELGAGTDPVEGAALAVSIIEAARGKGAVIAATTHYAELKVYALNNEKVQNASCEFDVETLSPTYHIVMGLPGKSNAFAIARKLGLDDAVIDDAEARVASSEKSFEDTISRLNVIRMRLESEKTEISQKLRQITENEKKSARLRAELEVKMEKSDLKARREAQRIIDEARNTAEEVFAELDEIRKRSDEEQEIDAINRERNILRAKLNKAVDAVSVPADHTDTEEAVSARPVKAGDTVLIKSMKKKAEVLSVSKDGTLQLRAGIININASQDDVLLLEEEMPQKKPSAVSTGNTLRSETLSASIDLRGMESAEAVYVAEQYLDNAVLAKLEKVTIIHGKGTGALRTAIHAMLKKNKLVKSFRLGVFGEGETGVTIVELK
ncbi:MAG: endonuclease MutS2 [Oscillospiraceae bacterium]|nr:endonuclease MutS2 [Oscillospiraceae bacterium]